MRMTNPRADFLPIIDRKPLSLPGGARLAVWTVINIEAWDFDASMPRTVIPYPQGAEVTPDIPNYSWFDYGLRVGFWRLKEVLDRHEIPVSVNLNGIVCEAYPRIVTESLKSGWEFIGHNYTQRVMSREEDEQEAIRKTKRAIEAATNEPMRGWMGPGLSETENTLELLVEEGVEYVADWVNDDLPYRLKVDNGMLYSIPYTLEINDIVIHLIQHHASPVLFERARDQFDTLYREGENGARVMCVSVHPYVSGAAHRIKYYEMIFEYMKKFEGVLFMTGSEIIDWYKSVEEEE